MLGKVGQGWVRPGRRRPDVPYVTERERERERETTADPAGEQIDKSINEPGNLVNNADLNLTDQQVRHTRSVTEKTKRQSDRLIVFYYYIYTSYYSTVFVKLGSSETLTNFQTKVAF